MKEFFNSMGKSIENLFKLKKLSFGFKIGMIVLTGALLLLMILSITSTHGTYIYNAGTSSEYDVTGITDKDQIAAIQASFATRSGVIGGILWGDESLLKVGIFFAGIAFIGSVFHATRWFKGEFANFFSSCFIAVSLILAFALSSNTATLTLALVTLFFSGYAITESSLVTFKKLAIA